MPSPFRFPLRASSPGLLLLCFLIPGWVHAQQAPPAGQGIGVVTALQGQATVARLSLAEPAALHFRDNVFLRDQITTRERSTVRLLLGGKGTLTIREQSQLTLDESLTLEGGRRSTVSMLVGKIGAAIARALMRAGDEVEIRTPNAITAVRGTVLIVEYVPPQGRAATPQPLLLASAAPGALLAQAPGGTGGTTNVFVLSGQATITPQGQPPLTLGPLQAVSVVGIPGGARPGAIQNITPAQATQAAQGLDSGKPHTGEADGGKTAQAQQQLATQLMDAIVPTASGALVPNLAPSTPNATIPPVVVTPPVVSAPSGPNLVTNGGFETGDFANWTVSGAASVIPGFPDVSQALSPPSLGGSSATASVISASNNVVFTPPAGQNFALIHTGTGAVNDSTSTIQQAVPSLSPGSVYLVGFKHNFMSNEYPTQEPTFNDTFEAKLIDGDNVTTLAKASRNTEAFKTDKPDMSASGFTLGAGNGYIDLLNASKTVVVKGNSATLDFTIFDVEDTSVDSGSLITSVSLQLDPPLYLLTNGQTLTRQGSDALVELLNESRTFDSVLVSSGRPPVGGWSVDLGGPLLHGQNASLNVPFSLLGLLDGSNLRASTSKPLVWLEGGTYALSTLPGTAIFDFWGTQTAVDSQTGVPVGTGQTVNHAGPLLEASGGATVTTQKILKFDAALLAASAPIIRLIGSADSPTMLTSLTSALDMTMSKVTSLGPLVALDKGILNIVDGALLTIVNGSIVNVTGELLSLTNGSKINVINGPLISVVGAGSVLDVSGALVNFSGTGGNQIIVNNKITPTAILTQPGVSGVGISATNGGSISIGPNPVKNPTLGTITVTGSLIQATSGGTVKIGGN